MGLAKEAGPSLRVHKHWQKLLVTKNAQNEIQGRWLHTRAPWLKFEDCAGSIQQGAVSSQKIQRK